MGDNLIDIRILWSRISNTGKVTLSEKNIKQSYLKQTQRWSGKGERHRGKTQKISIIFPNRII